MVSFKCITVKMISTTFYSGYLSIAKWSSKRCFGLYKSWSEWVLYHELQCRLWLSTWCDHWPIFCLQWWRSLVTIFSARLHQYVHVSTLLFVQQLRYKGVVLLTFLFWDFKYDKKSLTNSVANHFDSSVVSWYNTSYNVWPAIHTLKDDYW